MITNKERRKVYWCHSGENKCVVLRIGCRPYSWKWVYKGLNNLRTFDSIKFMKLEVQIRKPRQHCKLVCFFVFFIFTHWNCLSLFVGATKIFIFFIWFRYRGYYDCSSLPIDFTHSKFNAIRLSYDQPRPVMTGFSKVTTGSLPAIRCANKPIIFSFKQPS